MAVTGRSSNSNGFGVIITLVKIAVARKFGVRSEILYCLGLEAIVVGLGAAGPYALKVLIDSLSQHTGTILWAGLLATGFIASWLGASVMASWRQVFSQRIINSLNQKIVDDALKVSLPTMATVRGGDSGRLLGLIERLPFSLQVIIEGLIWQIGPTALQVLISLFIIGGILKPLYVLILGVTLLGFALSTWYGAVRQHRVSLAASAASGKLSQTVADVVRNARRVVLNGALPSERLLIDELFSDRNWAFGKMLASQVTTGFLQYGVAGVGLTALLSLGAADVLAGRMTVGGFILLQAYAFRLVLPLSGFGYVISQAALAFINVRDVLDLGGEAEDVAPGVTPPSGAALIELKNVAFSYGLGMSGLHEISFTLEPGSFNVIVGPNGSGKSTLAQIMAGILEPTTGEVLIDDIPINSVPRAQRYRFLLYVPQAVGLLNRSLLENGLYPPSGQTEAELKRLLVEWRFFDPAREIDFKAGVGEQGERLSGGQIQKLELARIARVKVPAIILDESTSALDPVSEADIIRTLRDGYRADRTLIMITHRKAIAEAADQVLFLKNGTLLRSGPHEVLMQDSAAYARLWEKQT